MKVKKVSNLNRYICHEIRDELDTFIIHVHFLRNLKTSKLKTFSKTCVLSKHKKRMKLIKLPVIFEVLSNIVKTLSNIYNDEAYWELWPSQNSLCRHFQAYSGDIQQYSAMLRSIFSHFQTYWETLRHIDRYFRNYWEILRHTESYPEHCATLAHTTVPYSELFKASWKACRI